MRGSIRTLASVWVGLSACVEQGTVVSTAPQATSTAAAQTPYAATCGNGLCETGENTWNCCSDCGCMNDPDRVILTPEGGLSSCYEPACNGYRCLNVNGSGYAWVAETDSQCNDPAQACTSVYETCMRAGFICSDPTAHTFQPATCKSCAEPQNPFYPTWKWPSGFADCSIYNPIQNCGACNYFTVVEGCQVYQYSGWVDCPPPDGDPGPGLCDGNPGYECAWTSDCASRQVCLCGYCVQAGSAS
jgi:hypothetical protein